VVNQHRAGRAGRPGRRSTHHHERVSTNPGTTMGDEWVTTAVHEAGHATAYVVHGQPFEAVRVWEVDGLVYGVTAPYRGQVDPLPHLVRVYAGPVAEGLYQAGGPPADPPALVLPAYEDVGADGRENDEDAATRMRTHYRITESPGPCERHARELIISHWPMVLMIAAALLEHEVLTYDEVRQLVLS